MYYREIIINIIKWLDKGKIAIVYGTRQVGKTTLTQEIIEHYVKNGYLESDIKVMNGDNLQTQSQLSVQDYEKLKQIVAGKKLLVVDEAQRVLNIGINLKIIYDHFPDLKIIATGSSSFELANKINEPLTGRNIKFMLLPLSFLELTQKSSASDIQYNIDDLLVFGSYPNLITLDSKDDKITYLSELSTDYLYKDILAWEDIRKPQILVTILKYLALNIGNTIIYSNISNQLDINIRTIEKYIALLEKTFVIFKLNAYSTNKNNELNRSVKIYFWDLGIRNSLINNFNNLEIRSDVGVLWENYCISERIKKNKNNLKSKNYYFWRNYSKHEVDFIEEYDGILTGFEFKYAKDKIQKGSYNFIEQYPNSTLKLINKDNIIDFLM